VNDLLSVGYSNRLRGRNSNQKYSSPIYKANRAP